MARNLHGITQNTPQRIELAGFRSTAIDAWLGHDDKTAKKHYSRVTEMDFKQASETATTGVGGGGGGDTQASLGGHESPNEKRKRLKPSENATVASDVSFGVTPTGLEGGMQTQVKKHSSVESDAIYADLLEILTRWPTLPAQVRAEIMSFIHSSQAS